MKRVKISLMAGMVMLSVAGFAQNKKNIPPPPPPPAQPEAPIPPAPPTKVVEDITFTPPKIVRDKDMKMKHTKPKKPLPPPPPPAPPKED